MLASRDCKKDSGHMSVRAFTQNTPEPTNARAAPFLSVCDFQHGNSGNDNPQGRRRYQCPRHHQELYDRHSAESIGLYER